MYMVVFKNDIIKRWLDILSNLGASGDCLSYRAWILIAPKGENIGSLGVGKKPLALTIFVALQSSTLPNKILFFNI